MDWGYYVSLHLIAAPCCLWIALSSSFSHLMSMISLLPHIIIIYPFIPLLPLLALFSSFSPFLWWGNKNNSSVSHSLISALFLLCHVANHNGQLQQGENNVISMHDMRWCSWRRWWWGMGSAGNKKKRREWEKMEIKRDTLLWNRTSRHRMLISHILTSIQIQMRICENLIPWRNSLIHLFQV